jgi:hypothetical protein
LPLGRFPDQAAASYGNAESTYATVVPVDNAIMPPTRHTELEADSLYVKVENANVSIDPMSRINLTTPLTVGHNVMVQNIGRVVGDSVALLDKSYADSLRHTTTTEESE